jgi:hypothetical protein
MSPTESTSTRRLAAADQSEHTALAERVHRAMTVARTTTDTAVLLCAMAEAAVADRPRWQRLWDDLQAASESVLVCCAYCHRLRAADGAWLMASARTMRGLCRSQRIVLSHGVCPPCAAEQLAILDATTAACGRGAEKSPLAAPRVS